MLQEIHLHFLGHEIPVYGYGLMLVAAFLACVTTGKWLCRHSGINPELIVNAALIAMITGIAGARICHVLENFSQYTRPDLTVGANLRNVLNIREGGLTFYGGFLLATPCCIFYARMARVPIRLGMDVIAPVLMIGLGLGRIGCFLNGCCYGEQCTWGVKFPYYSNAYIEQFERHEVTVPEALRQYRADGSFVPLPPSSAKFRASQELQRFAAGVTAGGVQPRQLYSALSAFLLAGLLIAYFTLPHFDGRVFAMMLVLEGVSRFILEMLRVEPAVWPHAGSTSSGLSISMILGMVNVVAGMVMWWAVGRVWPSVRNGNIVALVAAV